MTAPADSKFRALASAAAALVLSVTAVPAQTVGVVVEKDKDVDARPVGLSWQKIDVNHPIELEMIVRTSADEGAFCLMTFYTDGALFLWRDAEIKIDEELATNPRVHLERGLLRIVIPRGSRRWTKIRTPTGEILLKKTFVEVEYNPVTAITRVVVLEGTAQLWPVVDGEPVGKPTKLFAGRETEIGSGRVDPPVVLDPDATRQTDRPRPPVSSEIDPTIPPGVTVICDRFTTFLLCRDLF